ncbi:MAG TPA: SsrA-binding protein SmpB [Polyangiaceae bacterium LLY-WYZ-14_1]|nr:SsrA-binding protein SmpB [Polyangiaceae bacterium LLY-WYZ-14_1]
MAKKGKKESSPGELLVARNPKATAKLDIEERLEAGLVLTGSEVKSLRNRRADLEGAYATIDGGELFLHQMHVAPYEQAGAFGHAPKRTRKLLVHRRQIERLQGRLALRGFTLVPLQLYFKNGRAKIELGLGKGKAQSDRREAIRRTIDLAEARQAMRRGKGKV